MAIADSATGPSFAADGRNNAELSEVGPQGIGKLGALAHQDPPNPMQHHDGLLLSRLDADEAHGRPGHRLADRLRICLVVLAALDVGFTYCAGISFTS
jgi:hypothetical protein